jgi:hypothetical protein
MEETRRIVTHTVQTGFQCCAIGWRQSRHTMLQSPLAINQTRIPVSFRHGSPLFRQQSRRIIFKPSSHSCLSCFTAFTVLNSHQRVEEDVDRKANIDSVCLRKLVPVVAVQLFGEPDKPVRGVGVCFNALRKRTIIRGGSNEPRGGTRGLGWPERQMLFLKEFSFGMGGGCH